MRVVRCSASAIGRYDNCSFSYFLHYILGLESKTGKAALQGKIVHQALDWMARLRKHGKTNVDPMWLLDRAWDELIIKSPEIEIRKVTTRRHKMSGKFKEAADFKKCRVALETVLADPFYNPYKLKVLDSEQWFSLELPGEEWKCLDQSGKACQFTSRGFIDLVHEIDNETIEIADWKTGVRKNLHTQEPVDELALTKDIQARLYHLAAYFLYPKYKNILITFYFTGDGGPVTVALSQDDVAMTIAALHRFFTTIRKDTLLLRNRNWKCKMCSFNKNDVCQKIWSDLCTMGSEYIEDRYKEQLTTGRSDTFESN